MRTSLLFLLALFCIDFAAEAQTPDFRNIEYGVGDTVSLKLDMYLPKGFAKPYPVIVWIHGGAWMAGSKDPCPAARMTTQGYAVVSISYRLSQQGTYPAQIHDCKGAIRWIRANAATYGFDADRIGAWGSSAGGHLVALLGTAGNVTGLEGTVGGNTQYSSAVQAVCDYYGPSNFLTIGDYPSGIDHDAPDSPEGKLIGGAVKLNPDKANAASPIYYVTSNDAPFLIVHGTSDNTVPFHQSVELDSALRAAGVWVRFMPLPGAGHGGAQFNADSVKKAVDDFFRAFLSKPVSAERSPAPTQFSVTATPNPFTSNLRVTTSLPKASDVSFTFYNLVGKRVFSVTEKTAPGTAEYEYRLASLPKGFYFLRAQTASEVRTIRVIKR